MSRFSDSDRIIALAGIFQAARLVRDIARQGHCDSEASHTSIDSLFDFAPDSVSQVFGGQQGVASGLRTLVSQLESPRERDLEIAQYVIAMIHLADKLLADADALSRLGEELKAVQARSAGFELTAATRLAQIERLYQEHISVRQPQIMVRGEPVYLQNSDNAAHIRALLLSGIRAAILWRQCGGKKRSLLFARARIARLARELLDRIE